MHDLNQHFSVQLADLPPNGKLFYLTLSDEKNKGHMSLQILAIDAANIEQLQTSLARYDFIGFTGEDNNMPRYQQQVKV